MSGNQCNKKNAPKAKINSHILDLFLSIDLSECSFYDGNGKHIGYNVKAIETEAAVFLSHLHALGVEDLPDIGLLLSEWRQF